MVALFTRARPGPSCSKVDNGVIMLSYPLDKSLSTEYTVLQVSLILPLDSDLCGV